MKNTLSFALFKQAPTLIAPLLCLAALASPLFAFGATTEGEDRNVDAAAESSQKAAIIKLVALAKQKANTPSEPTILLRLAEVMHQAAAIEFRLAHGSKNPQENTLRQGRYRKLLSQTTEPLTRLITKYPKDPSIPRAYFLRGKAYNETDNRKLAEADFRALIDNYPTSRDVPSATFYLYDLLTGKQDYKSAVFYLAHLNSRPSDTYYTLVLDHLAWAHYYMNELPEAIKYIETEVDTFPDSRNRSRAASSERDRALLNAALYWASGVEKKNPAFPVAGILQEMNRLKAGPELGHTLIYYSYLLRTKALDEDLETLKNTLLASVKYRDGEAIDVALLTFENQLNHRRYDRMKQTSIEIARWLERAPPAASSGERGVRARNALSTTAAGLQQALTDNRGANAEPVILNTLASLYQSILKLSPSDHGLQVRAHYNLAEILFQLKDYEGATTQYHWVAVNGKTDPKGAHHSPEGTLVEDARLKAISSRYEALREKGLVPKDLVAKSITGAPEVKLPEPVQEWVQWVDDIPPSDLQPNGEVFVFEACRILYSLGDYRRALGNLALFVKEHPKSKYAIPAASLILDTYVTSQEWELANATANDFMKMEVWKGTDFRNRISDVAGATNLKIVEGLYQKGQYADSLAKAQAFLDSYPSNKYRSDCLALAANAALGMKDKRKAMTYFAPLLKDGSRPDVFGTAYLTAASLAEEDFDYAGASRGIRKYLAISPQKDNLNTEENLKYRKKALLLGWISSDKELVASVLNPASKDTCGPALTTDCERYRTLTEISTSPIDAPGSSPHKALDRIWHAGGTEQTLLAVSALESGKSLSLYDNLTLLDLLAGGMEGLDGLSRFTVIPTISETVPLALRRVRAQVRSNSRLRFDKGSLTKRIKLIEETTDKLTPLAKLSWARIKIAALDTAANLYHDFIEELRALPAPEGLKSDELTAYRASIQEVVTPFEGKQNELRKKAFELVADAGLADTLGTGVVQAFFSEQPDAAKEFAQPWQSQGALPNIDLTLLYDIDPKGAWIIDNVPTSDKNTTAVYQSRFGQAVRARSWARVAFLLDEGKTRGVVAPETASMMLAIALSAAGAEPEALAELREASDHLGPPTKGVLIRRLLPHYYRAFGRAYSKTLVESFFKVSTPTDIEPGDETLLFASAVKWSNADIRDGYKRDMLAIIDDRAPASGNHEGGKDDSQ